MDHARFDQLTRRLTSAVSRRSGLGLLLAGAVAGLRPAPATEAKPKNKTCKPPKKTCGKKCVTLKSDKHHCGRCNNRCASGQRCVAGACTCPGGKTRCGSACVDLGASPAHCGACNAACRSGQTCTGGQCFCPGGELACGAQCIPSGQCCDNGDCTNDDQTCENNLCACPVGQIACDDNTCAACCSTVDCAALSGSTCQNGVCACAGGQIPCNGFCIPGVCCVDADCPPNQDFICFLGQCVG